MIVQLDRTIRLNIYLLFFLAVVSFPIFGEPEKGISKINKQALVNLKEKRCKEIYNEEEGIKYHVTFKSNSWNGHATLAYTFWLKPVEKENQDRADHCSISFQPVTLKRTMNWNEKLRKRMETILSKKKQTMNEKQKKELMNKIKKMKEKKKKTTKLNTSDFILKLSASNLEIEGDVPKNQLEISKTILKIIFLRFDPADLRNNEENSNFVVKKYDLNGIGIYFDEVKVGTKKEGERIVKFTKSKKDHTENREKGIKSEFTKSDVSWTGNMHLDISGCLVEKADLLQLVDTGQIFGMGEGTKKESKENQMKRTKTEIMIKRIKPNK